MEKVTFVQVPRTENSQADNLAKLASSSDEDLGSGLYFWYLTNPSIDFPNGTPTEVLELEDRITWATPIVQYLQRGILPSDTKEARKIRTRAMRYIVMNQELYRRGYSCPLLRCVSMEEADYILQEVHMGVCGNHSGGRALAHKIMRSE